MDEWIPKPDEQSWLGPPNRRPPIAIGVATPPPPPGPRRFRRRGTAFEQYSLLFTQLAVATAAGLAAAAVVPMAFMMSCLVVLAGGRLLLPYQRSRLSQRILYLGSSPRRAA